MTPRSKAPPGDDPLPQERFWGVRQFGSKDTCGTGPGPQRARLPAVGDASAVRCLERTASTGEGARATRFSIKLPATAF